MARTATDELPRLDSHDRRILNELQRDARLTNQELAKTIGLSPSACWRRVKAMEESGVILRYAAILDPKKVGYGECVFAHISLDRHSGDLSSHFAETMREQPEVMECYYTTGDADFLLRVAIPSVAAYDEFLQNVIFSAPSFSQVRSNFALRQIKFETALPIETD